MGAGMRFYIATIMTIAVFPQLAVAQFGGFDGFADGIQRSDVASTETGTVAELFVTEGQFVQRGQKIARLDDHTHRWQLKVAKHLASDQSEIQIAANRLVQQRQTVESVKQLVVDGNARPSELRREQIELKAALANHRLKVHQHKERVLQYQRSVAQLDKRTVTAPISGIVTKIHRQVGEFVSPNRPELVTVVDASQLKVEFAIPVNEMKNYQPGQKIKLRVGRDSVEGKVRMVGVEIDKASQKVKLRIIVANKKAKFRPGQECFLSGSLELGEITAAN